MTPKQTHTQTQGTGKVKGKWLDNPRFTTYGGALHKDRCNANNKQMNKPQDTEGAATTTKGQNTTRTQHHTDKEPQQQNNDTETQGHKDTETQRPRTTTGHRDTETKTRRHRSKGTNITQSRVNKHKLGQDPAGKKRQSRHTNRGKGKGGDKGKAEGGGNGKGQ